MPPAPVVQSGAALAPERSPQGLKLPRPGGRGMGADVGPSPTKSCTMDGHVMQEPLDPRTPRTRLPHSVWRAGSFGMLWGSRGAEHWAWVPGLQRAPGRAPRGAPHVCSPGRSGLA